MLNDFSGRVWRSGLFYAVSVLAAVMPAGAANVFVPAGGDLQGALNQAQAGDTITLAAGASFVGNFVLLPNNSDQWITIQSSAMSNLPGAGQRVSPLQATLMPKIISPNAGAALLIPSGANYYRIQGVEFTVTPGTYVNDLIQAGTAAESSLSQVAHDIDFDRDYIHGDPLSGGKRGLALNSGATTVANSYFAAFTSDWQDTQAICGWNGPGPFTIQNNHLEAGTEIVAFGGAPPAILGLIPSHIIIENNEFYKPLSWWDLSPNHTGAHVRAKNHIELKNAQNVLIENNTFTNNFIGADQLGFMLVFNVRDEYGAVPWATVSHVTVKNNLFQHTAAGVLFMGHDADGGGTAGNFSFANNVWLDMGGYGGDGRMYEVLNGVQGATIDHETAFPTGWLMVFDEGSSNGIKITNSILTAGAGIACNGVVGEEAISANDPDGFLADDLIIGGWPSGFSGPHFNNVALPGSTGEVGFVSLVNNQVGLTPSSPFAGAGTDGLNLGAYNPTPTALVAATTDGESGGATVTAQGAVVAANALNVAAGFGLGSNATVPNGWVNIISKASGKCMDLATWNGSNWGQAPGTPVTQHGCWGGAMQQFQFWPVYDGYKVTIQLSGQQFDMVGGPDATSPGVPLGQYPYWGGTNEIFQVNLSATSWSTFAEGYVTLQPASTGMCLTLADNSGNDGVAIVQQACTGADNQKWKLVPVQ